MLFHINQKENVSISFNRLLTNYIACIGINYEQAAKDFNEVSLETQLEILNADERVSKVVLSLNDSFNEEPYMCLMNNIFLPRGSSTSASFFYSQKDTLKFNLEYSPRRLSLNLLLKPKGDVYVSTLSNVLSTKPLTFLKDSEKIYLNSSSSDGTYNLENKMCSSSFEGMSGIQIRINPEIYDTESIKELLNKRIN